MPTQNSPKVSSLLARLQADFPEYEFMESNRFSWHAGKKHVSYNKKPLETNEGNWALLHELGHALLGHTNYESDVELLHMEVAAWQRAKELAGVYGLHVDESYVQDALDSYRDWLHVRATCPTCHERALQSNPVTYSCHNCGTQWHVARSRFCRPYRKQH